MKFFSLVAWLLFSVAFTNAQKSIGDLQPAHAAVLKAFLSANPDHKFLSETAIEAEYLASMREAFGKASRPYYLSGDFNGDRYADFAVILTLGGAPIDQGKELAETHRFEHKLAIVVFNGSRNGTFAKAFREPVQAPYVCYLGRADDRRRSLEFGIFETDAVFIIAPSGKGYIVKSAY